MVFSADNVADSQLDTVAAIPELKKVPLSKSSAHKPLIYEPTPSTSSAPTPPLPVTSFSDCSAEKTLPKTVKYLNRKVKRVPVPDPK